MEPTEFPAELGDAFFKRLLTKAHYWIWHYGLQGRADPLDIAQEALIQIYLHWTEGKLTSTDPGDLVRGLGNTIVKRRAIDAGRKKNAQCEKPAPHTDIGLVGSAEALERFPAMVTATSVRLRRIDSKDRVTQILDFLSNRERTDAKAEGDYELFVLRRVDELPYVEVAEIVGRDPEYVRSRVRRLDETIRRRFQPSGSD